MAGPGLPLKRAAARHGWGYFSLAPARLAVPARTGKLSLQRGFRSGAERAQRLEQRRFARFTGSHLPVSSVELCGAELDLQSRRTQLLFGGLCAQREQRSPHRVRDRARSSRY